MEHREAIDVDMFMAIKRYVICYQFRITPGTVIAQTEENGWRSQIRQNSGSRWPELWRENRPASSWCVCHMIPCSKEATHDRASQFRVNPTSLGTNHRSSLVGRSVQTAPLSTIPGACWLRTASSCPKAPTSKSWRTPRKWRDLVLPPPPGDEMTDEPLTGDIVAWCYSAPAELRVAAAVVVAAQDVEPITMT